MPFYRTYSSTWYIGNTQEVFLELMYEGKKEKWEAQRDKGTYFRSLWLLVTRQNNCPQILCQSSILHIITILDRMILNVHFCL